jgi:hypothetical protein
MTVASWNIADLGIVVSLPYRVCSADIEVIAPAGPVPIEDRLRAILPITDAALCWLDKREFPVELLDRTREILSADTAAVLQSDFSSRKLIATAAAGPEEEVRQGMRIPVGRGFAGRIAADRQPVVLDRVDHTTVLNPILWAKGIQSMVAGGRMIGVPHVGSLTPREFTGGAVGGRRTRSVRRSFPPNGAGTTLPGRLAAALGATAARGKAAGSACPGGRGR